MLYLKLGFHLFFLVKYSTDFQYLTLAHKREGPYFTKIMIAAKVLKIILPGVF